MLAPFLPSLAVLTRGRGWDDGADTRWMGALVYILGALLTGVLVALVPPTAEGRWGWIAAAVIVALRVGAAGGLLTGRGPVRLGVVYAISALNIAGLCVLHFLASQAAYFHDLVLIDLLYVAAVHTPGRTAAAVALAVLGLVPALVHGGEGAVSVAEWVGEAILWALVAGLVVIYTGREGGQHAPPPGT